MVKRKLYDLEACEELLKRSYGITVYKEQVMLSQKLADFSKGDADVLRKRWGKKQGCLGQNET
jgi:DNA polymerase-3 subunit alpha